MISHPNLFYIVVSLLIVAIGAYLFFGLFAHEVLGGHSMTNPDINRDGSINVIDLGVLLSSWNSKVVSFTGSSYSPSSVSVSAGASVVFVNNSSQDMWPASNNHPTHTILPGFDPLHAVPPGETYIFTFDQAGVWEFHDHINPAIIGSITVQ